MLNFERVSHMMRKLVISIACALIVLNALSPMVSAAPPYIFGRMEATITTDPGTIAVSAVLEHWDILADPDVLADPAWVLEQQDPKLYSMVWDPRPVPQGGDGASIDMWIRVEIKDLCKWNKTQNIAYDIEFVVYDVEGDTFVAQHHIQQPDVPNWTTFDGNQSEVYYLQANIGNVVDGEKYDVRLVINFQGEGLTGDDETTEGELFIQTP